MELKAVGGSSLSPFAGNQLFNPGKLFGAYIATCQEVLHHVRQASFEQTIQQMIGHSLRHGLSRHRRMVNKAATLKPMTDECAIFHFSQHGCDSGVSQVAFIGQRRVHFGDSGLLPSPEDLHDAELQIAQTMDTWFGHYWNY
jgi:hypothetical protein